MSMDLQSYYLHSQIVNKPYFRTYSVQIALAYGWRGSNTLRGRGRLAAVFKGKAVKVLMEIQLLIKGRFILRQPKVSILSLFKWIKLHLYTRNHRKKHLLRDPVSGQRHKFSNLK